MTGRVVCSYCRRDLGAVEIPDDLYARGFTVSHGACRPTCDAVKAMGWGFDADHAHPDNVGAA